MPELPDLEVYRGNIFSKLTSKRLAGVKVFDMKITAPQVFLEEELVGRELLAVNRYGKELFFDFADGRVIAAHLMLNGKVSIVKNADGVRGKVLSLVFENESLVFHDTGNIGTVIRYNPQPVTIPDALGDDFTLEYFLNIAKKKSSANIKAFLIDQKVVKGIGNAYADEILYAARVSPHCAVGKIPQEVMTTLYGAIGAVLCEAVVSIKAISPDIISGEERSFLKVHSRLKKKTDTGFPIFTEIIATKKTYFTQEQVFYK